MSYHDYDGYVSNSMRRVFRSSPVQYHWQYILGNRPEPTPQQVLGQVMHAHLANDMDGFAVAPEVDRRTKAGKATWAEFAADAQGTTIISADTWSRAHMMANAIQRHPAIARIMAEPGIVEHEFRTEALGIKAKCKPDRIWQSVVIDWKTTSDPSPESFRRSIVQWGYHQQAAWYLDVLRACGVDVANFLLVAVGNAEPYEVCAYYLPQSAIQMGRVANMDDISGLRLCYGTGVWTCPRHTEIEELDIPTWAYRGQ